MALSTLPPTATDFTGSVLGAGSHVVPVGARVQVIRQGTPQLWNVVVHRHDRNRTYRLRFPENDTFVTVHEWELAPVWELAG